MRKYCKAYKLHDVRQFLNWSVLAHEREQDLADEDICYVNDDFSVVSNPFQDPTPLVSQISPEWKAFCQDTLQFVIPADLLYAYEQPEAGERQAVQE